jgi:peptidoglycan hydrolase CwlO-like protein
MQSRTRALLLLLTLSPCTGAAKVRNGVTPIRKVIDMLTGLQGKLSKEAEGETKAYDEQMENCKFGAKDLGFEIQTAEGEIDDLTATIEKAKADLVSETTRIEALAADISEAEAELKAAKTIRANESAEFVTAERELVDVIDTLNRASNMLQRKLGKSALVQEKVDGANVVSLLRSLEAVVEAAALPMGDRKKLMALAQGSSEDQEPGAPAAEAYKSHSGNILEVLEDMREKAEQQLDELRKQETNAKHSYEMTAQSLEDQAAADTKEMGQAKSAKAKAGETKAIAAGDLKVAQGTLATSQDNLAELTKACKIATEDYDAATKSRAEEMKAIAEAKKVLVEMTGAADTTVYGGAAAFTQVRSLSLQQNFRLNSREDLVNFEVVNILRQLAKKDNSPALQQLSSRVAATIHLAAQHGEDPFSKVKTLIEGLIDKLEKEAGEDADHKKWCDKEYGDTKEKQDDLTATIESLSTKIDKASSTSMSLKEEVKETQAALAELLKSQAEANKVRSEQNALYVETKADLEQGLSGVRQAVKILRDYYSGDDAAHDKSEAGGSIIGLLEVVESDLSKSLAESEATEDTAASTYQKMTMENKLTQNTYESDVKYKTKEAASLDKSIVEMSSDRESAVTEMESVLEYSKSIRASCEVKPETYEDRKARRDAELAGLKEALEVLGSMSLAQTGSVLSRLRRKLF